MAARKQGKKPAGKRALGNDPFERGAAVRTPESLSLQLAPNSSSTTSRTSTSRATSTPLTPALSPVGGEGRQPRPSATDDRSDGPSALSVAPPEEARSRRAAAALRERLVAMEQQVESATAAASARLRGLALQETAGEHARELAELAGRLLPLVASRLGGLAALRSIFAGAAPGALDAYGMDRDLPARAAPLLDFLYASWWRVETRQVEHVPATGPVIIVANHGGALFWDALVLRLALLREHPARRELRPLLDDRALGTPVFGRAAARLGAVAATPEHALELLGGGAVLAVFPEGSRNAGRPWPERYRVDRFGRGGFARIALRTGAAVVPCAIVGSEETSAPFARAGWLAERIGMPFLATTPSLPLAPLGILPLPSRWSLRFGAPIDTAALGRAAADDAGQVLALTERTRSALQQMLDEDVAARRAVYL
ncbi:MAG TPA: lysophospholipid acyltransferase family protein [Anaeromyxobacteraceae bacterium]|nr:lysophospholipid acyltransferase family protein [Anaeromyxobacteraceae bacterium]